MTRKFNRVYEQYLNIFESNEHITDSPDSRDNVDAQYFTKQLVKNLEFHNAFHTKSNTITSINYNNIKQVHNNDGTITCNFTWQGTKGEYTIHVKQLNDNFSATVECDDDLLDSPKGDNVPWESYIDDITAYIQTQESQAEKEKTVGGSGEEAIQLTADQPSKLPGAPVPNLATSKQTA